ncbi:hypothetical protein F1880_006520, partial [Penicillium rolfsii]
HLSACTTLYVISRKGVYGVHCKVEANLIEDNWIMAYLLHSKEACDADEGGQQYTALFDRIRTHVGQSVPKLQEQSRWTDVPYDAVNSKDGRLTDPQVTAGRYLFKYDAAHIIGRRQTARTRRCRITRINGDGWVI